MKSEKITKRQNVKFKVYLGRIKGTNENVYLEGFEWSCGWYWSGGGISTRNMWAHFDSCFLDTIDSRGHSLGNFYDPWTKLPDYLKKEDVTIIDNGCSVWEDLGTFLDFPQYDADQWWRIKDLYKQFYIFRDAAEAFQHGGHCTNKDRSKAEINKRKAKSINDHIENVIIPEIVKALNIS